MEALVFDVHRGTTHDGPGMRTTIFLKGCPLKCAWCHNPESISPKQELRWNKNKCIGCMLCVNAENSIVSAKNGEIIIEKQEKVEEFSKICPAKALELVGEFWTVERTIKEALKDEMFFSSFEGGVTFSGGEPLLQAGFLREVFEKLKAKGVNIALDTSGFSAVEKLAMLYPFVDVFLYDIKFFDSDMHEKFTGVGNELILENLIWLAEKIKSDKNKRLWIRTPLIPEATANAKNIEEIAKLLKEKIGDVFEVWELCTFNNVCRDKYKKMKLQWQYANTPLMSENEVSSLLKIAQKILCEKVSVSGLTAK